MAIESQDESIPFSSWRRRRGYGHSAAAQFALAVALIAFGILLFLDNVGILPIRRISEYWPVIPIVVGMAKLVYRPTAVSALWACFFIVVGAGFLLINLNVFQIHDGRSLPIALLCITFGFAALVKTVDKRTMVSRQRRGPGFVHWTSTDILTESVVMGSLKRRVESANFLGGELHNVMGNIELDLRGVQLPAGARSATIEVECIMGATKIRVSESWKVCVQAQGIMGNVEDKTLPPRMDLGENTPTLVITGSSVMGNVELEN